jgi:phosphoribosylglycinamide formyltransferase-1
MIKLGLITYDIEHLKTEQLVSRYVKNEMVEKITLFALPFKNRKHRDVLIHHRPNMNDAIPTESLAELSKVSFCRWDGNQDVSKEADVFVIGGAGILDTGFAGGKPIVNAHPGIIPLTRGLDSFKWAIYHNVPIGNTLHLIDNEVDRGDILDIQITPVFSSDTIDTVARRHYELEIEMLSNVLNVLDKRVVPAYAERPATMRMGRDIEVQMIANFEKWKKGILKL